jgi:hypothetical protein
VRGQGVAARIKPEYVPNKTPENSLYRVITKTPGMIQANKVVDLLWLEWR